MLRALFCQHQAMPLPRAFSVYSTHLICLSTKPNLAAAPLDVRRGNPYWRSPAAEASVPTPCRPDHGSGWAAIAARAQQPRRPDMDALEEGPSEQEEGVEAGSRKRIKVSVSRQEMRSHNRRERERRERQRRERLVEVRCVTCHCLGLGMVPIPLACQ